MPGVSFGFGAYAFGGKGAGGVRVPFERGDVVWLARNIQ